MYDDRIERLRGYVMFVVAWLIGLYVFGVVQESFQMTSIGLVAGVLTLGVNIYSRKRAAACVEATWAFKFWLNLPIILFIALPIIVKIVAFFIDKENRGWWVHFNSLLPFVLKLGVPVFALLWVYFSLGRMVPKKKEDKVSATE